MKNRLIDRGLLERNVKGHLRVTAQYTEIAVNKVHQQDAKLVNKVPQLVNKVHSTGELSSPKNNNRITKEIMGNGYKKAQDMAALLKARRLTLK